MKKHARILSGTLALAFILACLTVPLALALDTPSDPVAAPTFDGAGSLTLPMGAIATIYTPQGPLTAPKDGTVSFEITVDDPRVMDVGYQLDGVDHWLYVGEARATQFTGSFQIPAGASYRIHNASAYPTTITNIHFE